MTRVMLGLAIGSGLEGIDVVAVRIEGLGLSSIPSLLRSARLHFPPALRDVLSRLCAVPHADTEREASRSVADCAVQAIRNLTTQANVSHRDLFAIGFLEPARSPADGVLPWSEVSERLAEQTGITVVTGFRARDRAVSGCGHPITAAADFLRFQTLAERPLLVHLGAVASVLLPDAKFSSVGGFDVGPGNQLLDAIVFHGTRGRERIDTGGKKAVQGCCHEPLLAHWRDHPHFTRRPPKSLHPEAFGRTFLLAAFETARGLGIGLPDLLCSATHLIANTVADAVRPWLSARPPSTRIVASGGGVRNGFLMQLLRQRLAGTTLELSDAVGIPTLARNATAAAILSALACDGAVGNLPHLTGAASGRVLGRFVPGDLRNWSRCASWLAEQFAEQPRIGRAA